MPGHDLGQAKDVILCCFHSNKIQLLKNLTQKSSQDMVCDVRTIFYFMERWCICSWASFFIRPKTPTTIEAVLFFKKQIFLFPSPTVYIGLLFQKPSWRYFWYLVSSYQSTCKPFFIIMSVRIFVLFDPCWWTNPRG